MKVKMKKKKKKLVSFLGYNNDGSVYTTYELENNSYIDDEDFSMMMLVKKEKNKIYTKEFMKKEKYLVNYYLKRYQSHFYQ